MAELTDAELGKRVWEAIEKAARARLDYWVAIELEMPVVVDGKPHMALVRITTRERNDA